MAARVGFEHANLGPSGCKALNLPLSHPTPQSQTELLSAMRQCGCLTLFIQWWWWLWLPLFKRGSHNHNFCQNLVWFHLGADIIMALDDVVHSTVTGPRVEEAMYR